MCSTDNRLKPSPSAYVRNLRKPMPLTKKLKLVWRNNWTKVRNLQGCCGNYGQPGC